MTRFSRRVALAAPVGALFGYALAQPIISTFAQDAPTAPEATLPVTVTNVDGSETTVTDISRIIPLSGDIAEIVWLLGLGGNIVGVDISATWPDELMALPKVGYERFLNVEGILSLEPTIVIGKAEAGPAEILDQVREAGVPVVLVDAPQTIEAPNIKVEAVATALGVAGTSQAQTLDAWVHDEIQTAMDLAATAESSPSAMIILIQQGGVQIVAGGGTVGSAMLEAAGAVDAATQAGIMGYQPVTAEALVAAAPDIIVTMEMGMEAVGGIDGVLALPGVAETPAGENRRIYYYDDEWLVGMTPHTGQQLLTMIADFHPDLTDAAQALIDEAPEATPAG